MERNQETLNRFLVGVFNEILKTEELCLTRAYSDLSLRELHLIEEVCIAVDNHRDNRATAIASAQRVTAGTLTTAVTLLERKGYLARQRDERDKRVVRIFPTTLGRQANECHSKFHQDMVEHLLTDLSEDEASVLTCALTSVSAFFQAKHIESKE